MSDRVFYSAVALLLLIGAAFGVGLFLRSDSEPQTLEDQLMSQLSDVSREIIRMGQRREDFRFERIEHANISDELRVDMPTGSIIESAVFTSASFCFWYSVIPEGTDEREYSDTWITGLIGGEWRTTTLRMYDLPESVCPDE
jgi:hypothetical protein